MCGHIVPFINGQICPMYAWTDLSNITLDTFGQLAKSRQWKPAADDDGIGTAGKDAGA